MKKTILFMAVFFVLLIVGCSYVKLGTPEETIKTYTEAIKKGDIDALKRVFTPPMYSRVSNSIQGFSGKNIELSILKKHSQTEKEAIFVTLLKYQTLESVNWIRLVRVDGEWKIDDLSWKGYTELYTDQNIAADKVQLTLTNITPSLSEDEALELAVRNLKMILGIEMDLGNFMVKREGSKILIEFTNAKKESIINFVKQQGQLYAKIGDNVIIVGGRDLTDICRTDKCSNVDPKNCRKEGEKWACQFLTSIYLSEAASEKISLATKDMEAIKEGNFTFLKYPIVFYLNGEKYSETKIPEEMKGKKANGMMLTNAGYGSKMQEAIDNANANMKELQNNLVLARMPGTLVVVNE